MERYWAWQTARALTACQIQRGDVPVRCHPRMY